MSIKIGADPAPETYADEAEHRAMIARHSRSMGDAVKGMVNIVWVGQVDTTANATVTTHAVSGVVNTDLVYFSAASDLAALMIAGYSGTSTDAGGRVYGAPATTGNAVQLAHPSNAISATFNVMVVRP